MRFVVLFSYNLFLAFSAVPKQQSTGSSLDALVQTETLRLSLLTAEFESACQSLCKVANNLDAPDKSSVRYGAKLFFLQTVCPILAKRFDYKINPESDNLLHVQDLGRFTLDTYLQFGNSIENIRKVMEIGDRNFLKKLPAGNFLVVAAAQFASKLIEIKAKTDAGILVQEELLNRVTQALVDQGNDLSLFMESVRQCQIVKEFVSNCYQSVLELRPLEIPGIDLYVDLIERYRSTTMTAIEALTSSSDLNAINQAQKLASTAYTDIFGMMGSIQHYMLNNAMSYIKSLPKIDPVRLTAVKFLTNVATYMEKAATTFDVQKEFRRKVLKVVIDQVKGDTDSGAVEKVSPKKNHRKKKGKKVASGQLPDTPVLATESVPVSNSANSMQHFLAEDEVRPDIATEEGWAVIGEPVRTTESDTMLSAVSVVLLPTTPQFTPLCKWHKNWADCSSSSDDGSEEDEPPEEVIKASVTPARPAVNAWASKLVILPEAIAAVRQQARRVLPATSVTAQKSAANTTVNKGRNSSQINSRTRKPW